jgi:adenylate cyclase
VSETRKLAAILVSDVVGYSRLTGADEDRILARLRALRSDLIDPTIAVHHGRVVKRTGDGAIVEFRSVVDAVNCAIEVQRAMVERNAEVAPDKRIEFRLGIHLGDVVEESDGDLMGDGVNIAARLQAIAKPGDICLSQQAYWLVKGRLDLKVSDLGATQLKNIAEPVHVYSLEVGKPSQAKPATAASGTVKPETLAPRISAWSSRWPALAAAIASLLLLAAAGGWFVLAGHSVKPAQAGHLSIVVLPFANLSGDPAQDYFADGVTENLTTELSRIRDSFVIARNTAFTYKGRSVDAKEIGKELGVRYVLEGSVQRDQNRVRVNAQLIDAESGAHLWADRFEEDFADLFKLQDEVVARIANNLRVELANAESRRPRLQNLDAVDLTMRGWALLWQGQDRNPTQQACDALTRAVELDPGNADAYAGVAYCHYRDYVYGWTEPGADYDALVIRPADRALAVDPGNGMAAYAKGLYLTITGRFAEAKPVVEAALPHNPNLAPLYAALAVVHTAEGAYDKAKSDIEQAMRLSPRDPQLGLWEFINGRADLGLGRYAQAIDEEHRAIGDNFKTYFPHEVLAAAYALSGQDKEARAELAEAIHLNPHMTSIKSVIPLHRQIPALVDGLRKAGLPEE